MNRIGLSVVMSGLVMAGTCLAYEAPTGSVSVEGKYQWRKENNPLTATFVPVGADKWDVTFTSTRRGKDLHYVGTAEGKLTNGKLKGEATTMNKKRKWVFEGSAKDGTLTCDHSEVKGEKLKRTGTFTMAPKGAVPAE